jgi:drug/metabolite transporter (DMT)-like permease
VLFVKIVAWNPFVIAGCRSFFAALFLLVLQRLTLQPGRPFFTGIRSPLAWFAGMSYSATMILFVVANKLTASANVIVLQYSAPVWAALFAAFIIREKPKWEHWVSLVLIFAGLVILLKDGFSEGGLLGDALAVLSGVVFGLASVLLRAQKDASPQDGMTLSHIITVAFCLPFMFIYKPVITPPAALSIIYMGVLQVGLAAALYSYGIKKVSAVSAMLIASIEPVFNPLWVFLVIGEKPTHTAFIGGAVILAAVFFSNIISWRREARHR